MPLSMHRASVPVFVRALKVLATLLEKGEAHAKRHRPESIDEIAEFQPIRGVADG